MARDMLVSSLLAVECGQFKRAGHSYRKNYRVPQPGPDVPHRYHRNFSANCICLEVFSVAVIWPALELTVPFELKTTSPSLPDIIAKFGTHDSIC